MTSRQPLQRIYVLYDPECGLCLRARDWALAQPAYVALDFLAAGSLEAARLFPALTRPGQPPEELIAIDDRGGVYCGGEAWVMILWAMIEYRAWALRISTPALLPLARNFFHTISENRRELSNLLRWASDGEIAAELASAPPACVSAQPVENFSVVREYLV